MSVLRTKNCWNACSLKSILCTGEKAVLKYYMLCCLWATVCKTVHPILSDCCLSVLSCAVKFVSLSVMFVYCGQRVGWIKMKLGMWLGHGPGHIVLDWDPGWTKTPLGMEVGLDTGGFVLDGTQLPPKGAQPPIFGLYLLWPNGWMHRDTTRCGVIP